MFKLLKKFGLYRRPATTVITVKDEENITDEIERSLWDIKEAYDLETEEVEQVVKNYKLRYTLSERKKEDQDA